MSMKDIQPVCSECESSEISFEALVRWNAETMDFEVTEILYKGHYCSACDGECRIDWKNLSDDEGAK